MAERLGRHPSDVSAELSAQGPPQVATLVVTSHRRLARWLAEVEGDLRFGGEFRARYVDGGWEGTGRVDVCDPAQRLLLTMRDADPQPGQPNETVIEATLAAHGDHTILVIEERGLPLDMVAAYGAGAARFSTWICTPHIAGRERGDGDTRWVELVPAYQALAANINWHDTRPAAAGGCFRPSGIGACEALQGDSGHWLAIASRSDEFSSCAPSKRCTPTRTSQGGSE